MAETVLVSLAAGVLTLTLNRPDKLNSFNQEMHRAPAPGARARADDAGVRAVLLTGSGRGFCAGQDLSDRDASARAAAPTGPRRTLETLLQPYSCAAMRALPKPVVCAVNGVAAGAGANVALACDIVLAARSARFVQAFAKIGLVPDSGGTLSLPGILGERARQGAGAARRAARRRDGGKPGA